MTWKTCVAAVLVAAATTAHAQGGTQPSVQWTLQVIRDGQQIDSFDATTTVGQAHTDTHHQMIAHHVGCLDHPAGDIDLSRTVTVSPTQADATGVTLAIDAQETLEESGASQSPEGCRLPPQPRRISASHPGLRVPAGQWANWQIVEKDPSLAYRVRAAVVPPASQAQPTQQTAPTGTLPTPSPRTLPPPPPLMSPSHP